MLALTYNIASGGFASYDSLGAKPERLDNLIRAIKSIHADIVGLSDTFRWKDVFTEEEVRQLFGYSYSYHIDMDDERVDKRIGVALLSRLPLIQAQTIRLFNRNGIKVTVEVGGTLVDVFVVYLDDISEDTRTRQVNALLQYIDPNEKAIVMGDLNALWPEHVLAVKALFEKFVLEHPAFEAAPSFDAIHSLVTSSYQSQALSRLRQFGFAEPLTPMMLTALTSLNPLGLPTIFPVDHILAMNCILSDMQVYVDKEFEVASDHLPLSAQVDF